MQSRITENGLEYTLVGDYYFTILTLPEEHRPIGKWGRLHREFLKTEHPIHFQNLILSGNLRTYLADLNKQVQERILLIGAQMKVCKKCGDIIESPHRHDFKLCTCGAVAVDGGKDYLRCCGKYEE